MNRLLAALFLFTAASYGQEPTHFDYDVARTHELAPHRRTIPIEGVHPGFNQIGIIARISESGKVLEAWPNGDSKDFWPRVKNEVFSWNFKPFTHHGKAVVAQITEYIDLVPPERLPAQHTQAPTLTSTSNVDITLERSGCYGTCPAYKITVSTKGLFFDGYQYVAVKGKRSDTVIPADVRKLAQRFVDANFYSMDDRYIAPITDNPGYTLTISIDGVSKQVVDYVGQEVGMPAVIKDLEQAVDAFADTKRWISMDFIQKP